ncbi:MAG: hypothetical protein AB7K09_23875 [Planctomycetota bacterium]
MECPFFNQPSRSECDEMTRFENIDHALSRCCSNFKACPLFWAQVEVLHARRQNQRNPEVAHVAAPMAG